MYRVRSTGEVKTQGEVRSLYPNTSFPSQWSAELVDNLGLDPVLETPTPTVTRYQTASKDGVEQDAKGNWVWKWSVSEMKQEAKDALDSQQSASVRTSRNSLLAQSDWTQVLDAQIDRTAWATYRQELRDITLQPGFPWDITWPTKPE